MSFSGGSSGGSASGAGGSEKQPPGHGAEQPLAADKSLLVFIYDYLRRRGMERSAELLAQEAELTTEQLGQCMQFVTQAIGANPSKSGFLAQFWMLLWDILVARSASAAAGKTGPGLPGILNQMMATGSSKTTPTLAPSPAPAIDNQELQIMRLHMAMAAAGLQGRDPTALSQAEMAVVAAALQQIPIPGGPGRPAPIMQAQAGSTAPSGNAPPAAQGQPTHQQIMQYQAMLMQQQQMMFHQYQMMMQQQMKASGASGATRQVNSQQQHQPQQPQRTQMVPMQSMPPRNIFAEAEDAMMSFLQVPSQPNRPQTAMENTARKSSLLLAGNKRQRSDSVSSDQLLGMPNAQLDPALFLNMPEFDEAPIFESPFADGAAMSSPDKVFGANLNILGKFDNVHEQRLASVHISADSRLAVSAGRDKKIVVYDIQEKSVVGVLPITHKDRVSRARLAPAGKKRYLVSGAFDKTVQLWDLGDWGASLAELPGKPVAIFAEDHSGPIISVAFANKADEQTGNVDIIASCDCEGTLVLRSIKENRVLQVISDPNKSTVRMISFYPDGDHLIALALDDRVDVYDWREGKIVYTIKAPNGRPVICIDWDRGVLLVTTDTDCYVWAVDFSLPLPSSVSYTGRMVAKFTTPGDKIHCGIVLRNGAAPLDEFLKPIQSRLILIGGWKKLFLWNIRYELVVGKRAVDERGRVLTIDAHDGLVAAVSSGGKLEELPYILSGGLDNNVILWKLASRFAESHGSSLSDLSADEVIQGNQLITPESPAAPMTGSSSVDELTAPLDFDPVTMFLNTDDL